MTFKTCFIRILTDTQRCSYTAAMSQYNKFIYEHKLYNIIQEIQREEWRRADLKDAGEDGDGDKDRHEVSSDNSGMRYNALTGRRID